MFELTNEQRPCFGLKIVDPGWERIVAKPSPYHSHATIAYLEGTTLRKFIQSGANIYSEWEICEELSQDHQYLLPKTAKGKPVLFSAANLEKRTPIGMCLSFALNPPGHIPHISLYSYPSQKKFYCNTYDHSPMTGMGDFRDWVENWCKETTQEDLADIAAFAAETRKTVKFREGDVFRFKINRRLYGYGRVLVDYALMRKKKIPFWDNMMGKPVACGVYHIVTERSDVTVEELKNLESLPSEHMMDNWLFYGDFEIIGNIPIRDKENYPIMYGGSMSALYRGVLLQCGKLYRKIDNGTPLFFQFTNCAIGFDLHFSLPVLRQCMEAGSNAPYWAQDNRRLDGDLRNPKFRTELEQIAAQFGLDPAELSVTYQEG